MAFKKAELVSAHPFSLGGWLYRDCVWHTLGVLFFVISIPGLIMGLRETGEASKILIGLGSLILLFGLACELYPLHSLLTRPSEVGVYLSGLRWHDIKGRARVHLGGADRGLSL